MEPSCSESNIATSICRRKLEDFEAPESTREKKKQKCFEDDDMREIAGTSLSTEVCITQSHGSHVLNVFITIAIGLGSGDLPSLLFKISHAMLCVYVEYHYKFIICYHTLFQFPMTTFEWY